MLSIKLYTPQTVMEHLRERLKNKRLSLNLTQEGLANKSGVSFGSIKRFETTGQVSLESLLKLSVVLECLEDFLLIAQDKGEPIKSIDELLNKDKTKSKKRGSIK